MKKFIIGKSDAGKRLDRFMEEEAGWPRSLLMKAIRTKKLKVNGKKQEAAYRTEEGDEIVSYVLERTGESDFSVVYEDDNILIADKKAGLLCMDSTGKTKRTLIDGVNAYLAEKRGKPAYMVHRIDFHTSGLMVIAKTEESKEILDRLIKNRQIHKTYLCVAWGTMEQKSGTLTHYLFKDAKKNKVFLSTVPVKGAKTAVMSYRVKAEKNGLSLVECDLLTGRTHQIRSQLASIGHPLLGDDKYGKKEINRRYREKGQLLCACRLSFEVKGKNSLSYLDGRSFTVPQVSFRNKYFSRQ